MANNASAAANAAGSTAGTPKKERRQQPAGSRSKDQAMAAPAATSDMPCLKIIPTTLPRFAPSATRMPISLVLPVTV